VVGGGLVGVNFVQCRWWTGAGGKEGFGVFLALDALPVWRILKVR